MSCTRPYPRSTAASHGTARRGRDSKRSLLPMLLALGVSATAAAQAPAAVEAEMDAALMRLAGSGQLPAGNGAPLTVAQPPRVRHELGAVLDLAEAGNRGASVLALTPGGAAERLGLQAGDRVLRINEVAIGAGADAAALRAALDAGAGALVIRVLRDGRPLELRGVADSVSLPGYQLLLAGFDARSDSTCGRVSVFDVYPRNQQVHPAIIMAIDGRHPGPGPSFRLSPGRHRITVAEDIDSHQFTGVAQYQRNRNLRLGIAPTDAAEHLARSDVPPTRDGSTLRATPQSPATVAKVDGPRHARTPYKDIVIDVEPGITYRIAAQFHPDRRFEIRSNAYWDPLLFAESPEPCR